MTLLKWFSVMNLIVLAFLTQTSKQDSLDVQLKPIPTDAKYKAGETEYDDGGMGPLNNFARSFINTSLPEFPTDFIQDLVDNFSFPDSLLAILKKFAGFIAAIVVGFLFVLIVPIVGCCFCCCRLCGNCGGKRQQEVTDNMHCMRRIFSAVLFGCTVFILVGNICTYVSNDRMTTALDKINDIVVNNLDDMNTFVDLVVKQMEIIGEENMNITRDAIVEIMDAAKMADQMSKFVLNELSGGAIDDMSAHTKEIIAAFDKLMNETKQLEKAVPQGSTNPFTAIITNLNTTNIDSFKKNDTISQVKGSLVAKINDTIFHAMVDARKNTIDAFKQMGNQTATMLSQIKDFQSNTKGSMNIASIKADVNTYADTAKTYDAYRQKGGLALSAMTTLIVVFLVLGVVFGTVGQGLRTPPTDRGCVSNSGGNLLMAGVAFIFIFSWLLMLLTMLCYILGGPMERFFCQSLADPELKLVKVMEKKWLSEDVKTAVGGSVTDVLQGCRDGKSAYLAFNLKTRFNISEIDEQLKAQKKNIDDQLNKTLANVANATGGMNDFDKTANASFTDLKTAFAAVQADELDKAIAAAQQIPIFGGIDLSGFKDATQNLKRVNASLQEWETKFVDGMKTASSQIQAKMPELVKDFQTKVMNIADNYVNSTKDKVINDVGKCTPVWNLYHSIVVVALCQYTIDSFNGFWFSIGWCLFFFMPSLVFGVKLAKHFRRMNPDDDEEGLHMGSLVPNKVAPAPDHHN